MTRLSVNVNKLATLRNSRGKNLPDVALFSQKILEMGAHGLTVHPRPDGRHIRLPDVWAIQELIQKWNSGRPEKVEFNIEGYPSPDFLKLIEQSKPDQCTLVPDPPEALTSNAGWDLVANENLLSRILSQTRTFGTRASLFVDPQNFGPSQRQSLARLKPERIELYTERYSDHYSTSDRDSVTAEYFAVAQVAHDLGIGVNAGHDLNQSNLGHLLRAIPWIDEVSIGHALICEALEQGLATTIANYLRIVSLT